MLINVICCCAGWPENRKPSPRKTLNPQPSCCCAGWPENPKTLHPTPSCCCAAGQPAPQGQQEQPGARNKRRRLQSHATVAAAAGAGGAGGPGEPDVAGLEDEDDEVEEVAGPLDEDEEDDDDFIVKDDGALEEEEEALRGCRWGKPERKSLIIQLLKNLPSDDEDAPGMRRVQEEGGEEEEEEGEEGEGEEEEGDGEGAQPEEVWEEDGGRDGTKLWCSVCAKWFVKDSFSAKQKRACVEEGERFCLRHTGTSGFGRTYRKRPLPPGYVGREGSMDVDSKGEDVGSSSGGEEPEDGVQ